MPEHRPRHHISPPRGWLNDANGLTLRDGRYHVFHQYNPDTVGWGTARWGHVSSADLVRWERHPIALTPSVGPDAGGCWSGCIVDDGGIPTAIYTGVESLGTDRWAQTVCLARGTADLMTFRRDTRSPVIAAPPQGGDARGFRDPFVWRDADGWAMVIGTGTDRDGGSVLLYRSPDLLAWRLVGPLLDASIGGFAPGLYGRIWECPQFVPIGDRHVLVFSVWDDGHPSPLPYATPPLHHAIAAIGTFDGLRFEPESMQQLDHGPDFYAPALLREPAGRILAWGWSWEALSESALMEQGWGGCLTFPRELGLDASGLTMAPPPEIARLRGRAVALGSSPIGPSAPFAVTGDSLDIEVRMRSGSARRVGVAVRRSADGEEETVIAYDPVAACLSLDRTRSSLDVAAAGGRFEATVPPDQAGGLDLRILVDRSIVEVYANNRVAITARVYPTRTDSSAVAVFADGGDTTIERAVVWPLSGPG